MTRGAADRRVLDVSDFAGGPFLAGLADGRRRPRARVRHLAHRAAVGRYNVIDVTWGLGFVVVGLR